MVHNKNITKTQKVRFFTGQLLTHIASLYGWKGLIDVDLENAEVPLPAALTAGDRGPAFLKEDFIYLFF